MYLSCLVLQALGSLGRYFFVCRWYLGATVSLVPKRLSCLKPCPAHGETGTPHAFRMLLWRICKVRAYCGIDWNHPIMCRGFGGTCQSSTAAVVFPHSRCSQTILQTKDLQLAQLLCIQGAVLNISDKMCINF